MIVISDATPTISLLKADKLMLLEKLYGKIIIPQAVYDELTSNVFFAEEKKAITDCSFIIVEQVHNSPSVQLLRELSGLDSGESEAIVLYNEKRRVCY